MKLPKNDNIFVSRTFVPENKPTMNMRKIYGLIIGLALAFGAHAQDPEFSQFYAAPVYTNPAMAGTAFCDRRSAGRFSVNYRNQWPSLPGTFRTFNATYDQHHERVGGGIGLMATYDRAGSGLLTTTSFSGVYSYVLPVNKVFFLRGGIQASYMQKSIDQSKLKFGDQIHPTQGFVLRTNEPIFNDNVRFPNFAAGILGYSEQFYAGFAIHNITEPVQSFYGNNDGIIPRRYTFHSGVIIPLDNKKFSQATLSPNALFMMQQNFTQLNFGFYANKGPLVTGLWYRQTMGQYGNSDAIMVLLGFRKDKFKFGYSYDITVSDARAAAPGSHEVSASIEWCLNQRRVPFKPIRCPDF